MEFVNKRIFRGSIPTLASIPILPNKHRCFFNFQASTKSLLLTYTAKPSKDFSYVSGCFGDCFDDFKPDLSTLESDAV